MSYLAETQFEGFLWFRLGVQARKTRLPAARECHAIYATMRAGPDARIASCTLSGIAESVITVSNPDTFMTL